MSEALYRKYRPQTFEDVVGQEHIERTIKNAIEQDKVSHAYLFCGPRGTGKTTTARLLAKALLCEGGPTADPDGTCEDCQLIAAGEHPDVYELDAASRTGVDNVREEIINRVQFAPTRGRYKVYIIDEVHMLSTAAFNALLKTLEEPPSHVVFILCTTDPQKVPETIHSRCQRFDFRRISSEAIVSRLGAICVAEDVEFEGDALDLIAYRAEGGMRNALTSLEQVIAFGEGKVTLENAERLLGSLDTNDMAEIVRFVGARDIASCFTWTAEYIETGADLAQFTRDLAEHIRNMYVLALAGADTALEVSEATRRELVSEMELFGPDRLARLLGVLGDLSAELKTSTNPRLSFEIALTRMVRPDSDLTLESLAERIEALESGYSAVAHVVSSSAPAQAAAAPAAPAVQQVAASAACIAQPQQAPEQAVASAQPAAIPAAAEPVSAFNPAGDESAAASAPAAEAFGESRG
ncbi:DNA polymerase III subunit gamma/tau, partial [Ellagibacter isourolithinifaciens]|uniref:DNA polymerase III subunit gamma/tau n=1 Tax=Ellagibacter isourolithinifaciens TaxID=2137581 RepID=UPI003A8F96CE